MKIKQFFRQERHLRGDTNVRLVQPIDEAAWIWMPGKIVWGRDGEIYNPWDEVGKSVYPAPFFRFRNTFQSDGTPLKLEVSADERYVLLLDGQVISRGPHRGMVEHWYYESYEISDLAAGAHCLEAVCWQLGWRSPLAQLSFRGGFVLKADGIYDAALTTGKGEWSVAPLRNTAMALEKDNDIFGVGTGCFVTGTSFLKEEPTEDAWQKAILVRAPVRESKYGARTPGWLLFPTQRPDPIYESKTPGKIVNCACDLTKPFVVPANSTLDLWWNLENYFCAYPELKTSGGKGAEITWGWTESLRDAENRKGDRSQWKDKNFTKVLSDTFQCDGQEDAFFTSPWWRCGCWCRILIHTADEALQVKGISIGETHYPLAYDGVFESSDSQLKDVSTICKRTLEMCMHEMMFDCPFYEQQMYPGDTRIQLQILNSLTRDDRMQHFILSLYDYARRDNGMAPMNFPTRGLQESATYTMCWILMFHDYMMWHKDADFLKAHAPGMRNALMGLALYLNEDGLLENLPGWSFMDWVTDRFAVGVAPDGNPGEGISSLNNLLFLLSLQAAASVEEALGETHLAAHWKTISEKLARQIVAKFWDEKRGMVADTLKHDCYSEHAQCLAILADCLTDAQQKCAMENLVTAKNLAPVSSYFAYYLFETYRKCGRGDLIMKRLDDWRNFLAWGGHTAFETQHQESRSDCHAWSASPLYFMQTAFAGVRPVAPFFQKVCIAPQPSGLSDIATTVPCPQGIIEVKLHFQDGKVAGSVTLPEKLDGTFEWNGHSLALKPGCQEVAL